MLDFINSVYHNTDCEIVWSSDFFFFSYLRKRLNFQKANFSSLQLSLSKTM